MASVKRPCLAVANLIIRLRFSNPFLSARKTLRSDYEFADHPEPTFLSNSRTTLFLALVLRAFFHATLAHASAPATAVTEVFGSASDGTVLHWDVYTPEGVGPWPAVLVIHGGGFYKGSPTSASESITCAQDLAAAGYIAFSIEYRLAPPGALAGQISEGRFPDQTDDVKLAVRAARNDPRCNGQVGAVGGSAGGSHTSFVAATGTPGDDRIDVGICLSGAFDLSDFSPNPLLVNIINNFTTYVGVPATDTAALRAASPAWLADAKTAPLFIVNSLKDFMPYSQLGDMIQHLDALGLTNYQVLSRAGNDHAFQHWTPVKDQALTFIANGFAGIPPPPPFPPPSIEAESKKLMNVSSRTDVGTGDNVMVGGFIVTGDIDKRVDLRAIGPSLGQFGVSGALANPILSLYDSSGTLIEANDNRVAIPGVPNPLLPSDPAESLLTAILPPGSYTAVLQGVNDGTGVALVEVYDHEPASSSVANISTRGNIGNSSDVLIGGFIVGGADPTNIIVRALGPSLGAFGVANALPDPVLELHDGNGALLSSNDSWRSDQEQEILATQIAPSDDREAAILATLPPGSYTALVRDTLSSTGIVLFEVYDLDLP